MSDTVVVYTKPECVQCTYTKKLLDEHQIPYETKDVTTDREARKLVEASGNYQLPMVVHGQDVWHGFRPEKLRGLR
jgi:glutaredoxin-like protein NrdH